MKKRVLLKDIAEKLNLTTNTVSRALHDREDISEKTKELVRRTADELGYIPDIVASSMRTSLTRTIAIVFDNLKNPYFMIMANSINKYLIEHGYFMMIFTVNQIELTMDVFKKMLSRRVDGVISFLKPDKKVAEHANSVHLPIFVVGREADDVGIDSIFTDDFNGGYVMGNYFYEKGYERVCYLGGPEIIMCNVIRANGMQAFYNEKGLKTSILHSNSDGETIGNLERLIQENNQAIFCFNDSIAYMVMLYVKEHYPNKRIEVTGYDNIASHLDLPISITTVGTDIEKMVSSSIEQLLKKIDDFNRPLFVASIPTFLVSK